MRISKPSPAKVKAGTLPVDTMSENQIDGMAEGLSSKMIFQQNQRRFKGGEVCAIFVHAGAGYHSVQNQRIHLQACEDAASAAMTFLNSGGSAVEAVELAIKVLEDKEITNAGFGSNLAIDGKVECDATVVDHYGRAGAVGAIAQIRNPIHIARLVLEQSLMPLALRRVPPNLLVGQGATEFAYEQGVPVLPHDALVSPAARERWLRWRQDLKKAIQNPDTGGDRLGDAEDENDTQPGSLKAYNRQMAGVWNESQSYSPRLHARSPAMTVSGSSDGGETLGDSLQSYFPGSSPIHVPTDTFGTRTRRIPVPKSLHKKIVASSSIPQMPPISSMAGPIAISDFEDSIGRNTTGSDESEEDDCSFIDDSPLLATTAGSIHGPLHRPSDQERFPQEDQITDTVGAIAVDERGNIAAGSSSGGIGMKHRGRMGPAALVGIGTAVLPIEPEDKCQTTVATVTSGTGEHMATTMAAHTCASRIYSSCRKDRKGGLEWTDDIDAMESFVKNDFMGHPSVKRSHSAGAIGVMSVKKTTEGIWLHFAHNTDSFAVASMSSLDDLPNSVMSRQQEAGHSIVTGGRSMKYRGPEAQEWRKHTTWAHKSKKARPTMTEAVEVNANTDGSYQSRPAKRQKMKQKKYSERKFGKLSGIKMAQRAQEMKDDAESKEQAARDLLPSDPETAHKHLEAALLQRQESERHLKAAKDVIAAEHARKVGKLDRKDRQRASRPTRKPSWLRPSNPAVASRGTGGGDSLGVGMNHGTGSGTHHGMGLGTILGSNGPSGIGDTSGSGHCSAGDTGNCASGLEGGFS